MRCAWSCPPYCRSGRLPVPLPTSCRGNHPACSPRCRNRFAGFGVGLSLSVHAWFCRCQAWDGLQSFGRAQRVRAIHAANPRVTVRITRVGAARGVGAASRAIAPRVACIAAAQHETQAQERRYMAHALSIPRELGAALNRLSAARNRSYFCVPETVCPSVMRSPISG
jgi:hypothetical protein